MPARKPKSLTNRHDTKEDSQAREAAEKALTPKTSLSKTPPLLLQKHKQARETWKRLLKLYSEVDGTIATAFDEDLLVNYCLAEQELDQLMTLRAYIHKLWNTQTKLLGKLKPTLETLEDYSEALAQANKLMQRFQGMDARLDGKRKLLHTIAQSLYLTPRARAGVAPPEKPAEKPKSEMGGLLDSDDE